MVPYLGCEHARDMLHAFVDGELPMTEQVAVESHLRWCATCAAHVEDLRLIGDGLRLGALTPHSDDDARELASLRDGVLGRVRAEREQSLGVQLRALFDDRHLLWAGAGALTALLVVFFGTMGVLHAANDERPDSLAGVIHSLANPGSERNPIRLDRHISAPRAVGAAAPALEMAEDEAVFALAAVVTREGRIANYELLLTERDGARLRSAAAQAGDVSILLDVVARSRFAPAQRVGGTPVAVNMVWLLARTTVKGTPRPLDFDVPAAHAPAPPSVVPAAKPSAGGSGDDRDRTISSRRGHIGRSRTV